MSKKTWFWADCKFSQKNHKSLLWKRKFFPARISPWPYDPKHESDSSFFHSSSLVIGPLTVCLWRYWDSCHSGNTSAPRLPNSLLTFATQTQMLSIIPRGGFFREKGAVFFSFQFCFLLCIIGRMILVELCKLCFAFSLGHSVALTFVPAWLSAHCNN